jgi:hypothetical protein
MRKVLLGEILEQQWLDRFIVEQRVPVPAQIDFRILKAGVDLVDRDEFAVARVLGEEVACLRARFEHGEIASGALQVVGHLQPGWAGSDDDIVVILSV